MYTSEKCIECFYGEYKKNIFGKKHSMKLFLYSSYLEGNGFLWYNGEMSEEATSFNIIFDKINDISITNVKGDKGIIIKYKPQESIVSSSENKNIIIMGIDKCNEVMELVKSIRQKYLEKLKTEDEKRKLQEQERAFKIAEEEENARQFFQECYKFHITNNNNPNFELFRENLQLALIYIDKDKNINFLRIDGNNHDESNGIIPFSKIHYYEKVGKVHYTSEISSKYSSFGGSITGNTFSKKATFWAGLLLGPMGMAGGALFSHKPVKIELPSTDFSISSDIKKIDDRNIMLNFYSEIHKQYIDIELPATIYNFLQTYLPEKKYDIVMELEKKSAVYQATKQIESGSLINNSISNQDNKENKIDKDNDGMTIFKQRLDKLKLMYDTGILTDAEFDVEKKKLLELI